MAKFTRPPFAANPHEVFLHAEYFNEAVTILTDAKQEKEFLAIPNATCAAFALELYLKCLLAIESPKSEFPQIHELHKLHADLSQKSQDKIETFFTDNAKREALIIHHRAIRDTPLTIKEEINEILLDNNSAFEGFRYAFGLVNPKLPASSAIWSIRQAVRQVILELHSEWDVPPTINSGVILPYSLVDTKRLPAFSINRPIFGIGLICPIETCKHMNGIQVNLMSGFRAMPGLRLFPKDLGLKCEKCGIFMELSEIRDGLQKHYNRKLVYN